MKHPKKWTITGLQLKKRMNILFSGKLINGVTLDKAFTALLVF